MCGFVGFVGNKNLDALKAMSSAISHRGPDGENVALFEEKVHFAHRRLAIIDLSPAGSQPMASHNGKLSIAYNGEVYNFQSIKDELDRNWRGHSDTEVIIEAISQWGVKAALEKMTGMFAFAVYDSERRVVYLARDRFGEKPLYYGFCGENFFFGSELKSFKKHPDFNPGIDRKALKSFFKFNYIPAPLSIYEGISKLEPGCYLEYDLSTGKIKKEKYWDFSKTMFGNSTLKFSEASQQLELLLKNAVKNQMVSDVPLGAFLSGGIDSSLIVSLMQAQSEKPVKTFTIGFHEKNFNEALFAKKVAEHLGTEHFELYVSPHDALNVVPKLSQIYDEPFSDSSQIPTYLVSEMTRKHVTVSLSGDAGDEVFGGYNRYFLCAKISKSIFWAPNPLRNLLSNLITSIRPGVWDKISPVSGDKMHKLASVLNLKNDGELYQRLLTHWDDDASPVLGSEKAIRYELTGASFEERMMLCDSLTYLPDDILVKVDRASMAVSLETRVPFLDHHVAEFGRSLPLEHKIRGSAGKIILRDILYRYVPRELIERPKMGFGVPLEHWLRNELKDWALNLLDEKKIKQQGLLDYEKIKNKWDEHQSGKRNWQYHLWDVLMFQDWYENNFIR